MAQKKENDKPGKAVKQTQRATGTKRTAPSAKKPKAQPGAVTPKTKQQPAPQEAAAVAAAPAVKQRKKKGPVERLVANIGNGLYMLGFSAELMGVRAGRILRTVWAFVTQLLVWLFSRLGHFLLGALRDLWRDALAPFKRFARRRAQLRRVRQRAAKRAAAETAAPGKPQSFFGVGIANTARLLGYMAVQLMPLAAAVVLVFTVARVLGMNYALAVEMNGEVLGCVANQAVVEDAKGLLRDRIRLAPNQELSDWQLNPRYTIASSEELVTTQQLVNNILVNTSGDGNDLTEATGLYIGGRLYAVTTEGDRLAAYLDGILEEHKDPEHPDAIVQFRRNLVYEPDNDDVYFTSSVEAYDELLERLARNVTQEVTHVATGKENYGSIAHEGGITFEQLQQRNPELMENATTRGIPPEGTVLLIERAEPFLQVELRYREMTVEPVPYNVIEEENPEMAKGTTRVIQVGEDGEMEVWEDYVMVDGELVERTPVAELTRILKEPVDRIVQVGTKEVALLPGAAGSVGPGGWYFPVPDSPYSSRGYSPGGHRGFDINAPGGSAILAAASGTVTTAGWHYSFGNYIVIDHGGGVTSLYAHCSALYVGAGETVSGGQTIAAVGSTGNSSGNHLHLEVAIDGALTDPSAYVGYPY